MSLSEQEWLAERAKGIGGSDIGAILGVSSFATPISIWQSKRGASSAQTEDTARGHDLEDYVAKAFERAHACKVMPASKPIYVDEENPIFRASIDRFFQDEEGNTGILECKTTRNRVTAETLPNTWLMQVQWYMGVTKMDVAVIAWLGPYYDIDYHFIKRDDATIDSLRSIAKDFWDKYVVTGTPPPPVNQGELKLLNIRPASGKSIEATDSIRDALNKYDAVKGAIKELEKQEEELLFTIKNFIGDAESLSWNGSALATYKANKDSMKLDEDKFKKENPDLWQKYQRAVPGARVLRVK